MRNNILYSKFYQITRGHIQNYGKRRASYRENLILSNPTFQKKKVTEFVPKLAND